VTSQSQQETAGSSRWIAKASRFLPLNRGLHWTFQRLPPIIVAPPGLGLNTALASAAFARAGDVNAVALVEEQGVVGVWGGPSLATVMRQWPRVTRGGSALPGLPQIPLIVRSWSWLVYRAAVASAAVFGDLVRSCFDLFRGDLLTRLGLLAISAVTSTKARCQRSACYC
jgi:hypothetical protein